MLTPKGASGSSSCADGGRAVSRAAAERAHDDHGDAEVGRKREELALALSLAGVVGNLDRVEASASGAHGPAPGGRPVVVRDPDAVEGALLPLLLEPGKVLLPRHEVVNLLDLDVPEPVQLVGELPHGLVPRRSPDLRRHGRSVAPTVERHAERVLGAAVHGR